MLKTILKDIKLYFYIISTYIFNGLIKVLRLFLKLPKSTVGLAALALFILVTTFLLGDASMTFIILSVSILVFLSLTLTDLDGYIRKVFNNPVKIRACFDSKSLAALQRNDDRLRSMKKLMKKQQTLLHKILEEINKKSNVSNPKYTEVDMFDQASNLIDTASNAMQEKAKINVLMKPENTVITIDNGKSVIGALFLEGKDYDSAVCEELKEKILTTIEQYKQSKEDMEEEETTNTPQYPEMWTDGDSEHIFKAIVTPPGSDNTSLYISATIRPDEETGEFVATVNFESVDLDSRSISKWSKTCLRHYDLNKLKRMVEAELEAYE